MKFLSLVVSLVVPVLPVKAVKQLTLHELPELLVVLDLRLLVEQIHHDLGVVEVCLGGHAEGDWR